MRYWLILLLLTGHQLALGKGADTASLKRAMTELNTALLEKDSVSLKRLLHPAVTYGHSNGWIEDRQEVMHDLYNGKLVYEHIKASEVRIVMAGYTASVRVKNEVAVSFNGTEIKLKLEVLQVWVYQHYWQLLSRQSVKID